MKMSIRWDKMFGPQREGAIDLEPVLPLYGHLYIVGINWCFVNPSWVRAFPFRKTRDNITNTPDDLEWIDKRNRRISQKEYIRLHTNELVPRETHYEPKRSTNSSDVQRKLRGYHHGGHDAVSARGF